MRGFVNRVRTSLGAMNVLYRLSGFLNLFCRRFDRADNRARRDAAALPSGYLNGQALAPLGSLPYGASRMSYSGCEVIAVYNSLLTLGRQRPLTEIAEQFEKKGILFNGFGGTNLGAAVRYLRDAGCAVTVLGRKRAADYDAALVGAEAALLAYWTGETLKRPDGRWNTLHTVSVRCVPGGVLVYNAFGGSAAPARAASVAAFLSDGGFLPVMLCAAAENPLTNIG